MNIYTFLQHRLKQMQLQFTGYVIFIAIATTILATAVMIKKIFPWVSQALLFFLGWITWTFLEYIAHRFWMHNKSAQKKKSTEGSHLYHHTHPTELKVSDSDRFLLLVGGILLLTTGLYLQNYFALFCRFLFRSLKLRFHAFDPAQKMGKNPLSFSITTSYPTPLQVYKQMVLG